MKHIKELNITEDAFVILTSHICGQAYQLRNQCEIEVQKYVEEIVFSYFNNFNRAISAYSKIHAIVQSHAGSFPDVSTHDGLQLAFRGVDHEILVNDYAYIFFSSLKSSIDMLACVIDFSEKGNSFKIPEKPYYSSIGTLKVRSSVTKQTLDSFRESGCVKEVIALRNKLTHEGYHIASYINPLPNVLFEQNISQGTNNGNKSNFYISNILSSYVEVVKNFDFKLSQQYSILAPIAKAKFNDYVQVFDFEDIKGSST